MAERARLRLPLFDPGDAAGPAPLRAVPRGSAVDLGEVAAREEARRARR